MTSIFVKGFDYGTDEETMKSHFSDVGSIKELYFQSRDSAVVTYAKASEANRAVEELHKTTIEGQSRYVVVKLDDPDRNEGEGKGSKGASKGKRSREGGSEGAGRTIFVHGFDFDTDDATLEKHFVKMGAIEDFHFQSKGSAVITYTKEAAAQKAVSELDGSTMSGQSRYVAVKLDDPDRVGKGDSKGKDKGSGKGGKGGKGSGKSSGKSGGRAVFVSGFDFDTDDAALTTHFGKMGAIETHHFQAKGSAVITFVKASAAQRATSELDGTTMKGQSRYVDVKLDDPDRKGRKGKGSGKGKGKW